MPKRGAQAVPASSYSHQVAHLIPVLECGPEGYIFIWASATEPISHQICREALLSKDKQAGLVLLWVSGAFLYYLVQKHCCLVNLGCLGLKTCECRQAVRDQEIGGYHIRKDQWVGCAVYAMHRDPKYWQVGCVHVALASHDHFITPEELCFPGLDFLPGGFPEGFVPLCQLGLSAVMLLYSAQLLRAAVSTAAAGSRGLHPGQVHGGNA